MKKGSLFVSIVLALACFMVATESHSAGSIVTAIGITKQSDGIAVKWTAQAPAGFTITSYKIHGSFKFNNQSATGEIDNTAPGGAAGTTKFFVNAATVVSCTITVTPLLDGGSTSKSQTF